LATLRQDLHGPLGYVLGVAVFLLALGVTVSNSWFQTHYPYLTYFLAALVACYAAGLGPAILVCALSSAAAYFTYAPARFFPPKDTTPVVSAVVMFFMILVCCWVLSALLRSRDRLEAERERYAQLASSRDLLYREMQHRVSNNIQIVGGLLRLQSQGVQDQAAKRALTEAASRIALIANIQRRLHDQAGAPAPFRRFAEALVADAVGAAGADKVTVEVDGGDEPLHVEQATPVSLVLLECVNNALEHAFAPGQAGRVRVVLEQADGHQVLTVRDDGCGLPAGFDPDRGDSLGLKIVRTMAGQLNGEFLIRGGDGGSVCRLRFPDIAEEAPVRVF
jgi:two-component sensor histidine kinase